MDEIFVLADKLRVLREEKEKQSNLLKEINASIGEVEYKLSESMTGAECTNFTRNGKQFIMTSTTRWSAEAERKDELYTVLKENGYEHLFTVNTQTLGSFIREQVNETTDENGETHIPDWLAGLVKGFDDIGITMKSAAKKSK
jgi:hypothetical protein